MFGSVWNFIKRHRRKFIFTGAVVGGVVLLTKYAKKKFQEFQEAEAAVYVAQAKRQHHFDSNQRTCNITVLSMIPNLRESLLHCLDCETLTAQLKQKPANKIEIWEELKVMSFTRTIVAVYSSCMLCVLLRVKLNIIGGYMYLDTLKSRDHDAFEDDFVATQEVQQEYLSTVHYLLGDGLKELITVVQTAVAKCLESKSLKDGFSLAEIQRTIQSVRRHLEADQLNGYHGNTVPMLSHFMISPEDGPEQAQAMSKAEMTLVQLRRETKDMLNSTDLHSVLTTCLDTAFNRLLDRIAEYYRPQKMDSPNGNRIINPNDILLALARVIPIMSSLVHAICCDAPNPFIQELLVKDQIQDLAANVYEAFSQSQSPPEAELTSA